MELMVVERWFVSGLGFWFVVELLLVILVARNERMVSTGCMVVCGGGWCGCYGKKVLEGFWFVVELLLVILVTRNGKGGKHWWYGGVRWLLELLPPSSAKFFCYFQEVVGLVASLKKNEQWEKGFGGSEQGVWVVAAALRRYIRIFIHFEFFLPI
ncbi:hypothetical protein H5410_003524 [Solanum commersonii]|uniref:Transmembrane protein n=1 Tax=Solanum commersonii TaxID=4109 RepID=A0A9J6B5W3_SOLCO|nr:hypothetical protein H5410_003524 [Solanum commersonii]